LLFFEVNRFVAKWVQGILYEINASIAGHFFATRRQLAALTNRVFSMGAGATFDDAWSISTDTDPWSCFGGKIYELSVCFRSGVCLTPKKIVW